MGSSSVPSSSLNEPLRDVSICQTCGGSCTHLYARTLGGQCFCSKSCAEKAKPMNKKDTCWGCREVIWERKYTVIKDKFNFCSLLCLSKFLYNREHIINNKRVCSPELIRKNAFNNAYKYKRKHSI